MKRKLIILLLPIFVASLQAISIDRVILSTDTNEHYIQFWELVAPAWKKFGIQPTLALIATKDTIIDESLGEVIQFEPIEGIPTSFQAQVIRLLLPSYFAEEVCLVSDIDMIPLNKEYFTDTVAHFPDDSFIVFRDRAYHPDTKQFPMCYIAAKGKLFKEVFKVDTINDIQEIIKQWYSFNLGWSTDELLLYRFLTEWELFEKKCIKLGHFVEKRIDRSYWNYDQELLKKRFYIDAHCPRPYSKYKKEIDRIIDIVSHQESISLPLPSPRFLENADYGTHMAPLITAVMNTNGPILEMGSGDFSTPLLHAICSKTKRLLLTTDTDMNWLNNFIDMRCNWHQFQYIPVYENDWDLNPQPQLWDSVGTDVHWAVVLIDHRPGERRVEDIRRLRNNADIFVIHDSQQPSYCYEPVVNSFTYKYVYTRYSTQTTIVSDTIDVRSLFEE